MLQLLLLPLLFSVAFALHTECYTISNERECLRSIDCIWNHELEQQKKCSKINCDDKTAIHSWHISYATKSTQFKIYDPCAEDKSFISIKIRDLTSSLYSTIDMNTKSSFKQELLKYGWDNDYGTYKQYEEKGQTITMNGFSSTLSTDLDSNFRMETVLFPDNSLKLRMHVSNSQYTRKTSTNYVILCMLVEINSDGNNDQNIPTIGADTYHLNGYEITNDEMTFCNSERIDVPTNILSDERNGLLSICYKFNACFNGNINWNTEISIKSSSANTNIIISENEENDISECEDDVRHRKDWFSLSTDEQMLYVEAFKKLRENGKLDVLTQAHSINFMGRLHQSSLLIYYHSYLIWETETAIRALGGKFACFAMPFYDWTKDSGNEENADIFRTGLGGEGLEANNYCIVSSDGFTLPPYLFPTPNLCSDDEIFPNCCLKRYRPSYQTLPPNSKTVLAIKQMDSENFDNIVRIGHVAIHNFIAGVSEAHMYAGYSSDDPVFQLAHSYMDLMRVVWQDCHGYVTDEDAEVNEDITDKMYHPYCYDADYIIRPKQYKTCEVFQSFINLDDELKFLGITDVDWTMVGNDNSAITIRNLFNINRNSRWKVSYDTKAFYDANPGLEKWCSDHGSGVETDDDSVSDSFQIGWKLSYYDWIYILIAIVFIFSIIFAKLSLCCVKGNEKGVDKSQALGEVEYGSMYIL